MRSFMKSLLVTALVGTTSACESTIDVHGNAPPPERLEMVKIGHFTRDDVAGLLGTPSSTEPFGDDSWYYISSRFETWAFFAPKEIEREIVAIDFDRRGYVSDIRKLSLDAGKQVFMVARETPTEGHDLGLLEQLLGNVGRFNTSRKSGPGGTSGGD